MRPLEATRSRLSWSGLSLAVAVVAAVAAGCNDKDVLPPTDSPADFSGVRIEVGDTVHGRIAPGNELDTITFMLSAGRAAALVVEADPGPIGVSVWDPATGVLEAALFVDRSGGPRAAAFSPSRDRAYRVLVLRAGGPGAAPGAHDYRLLLVPIRREPERVAGRIGPREVVHEALDPPADVDVFTFEAEAGGTFNVYLQPADSTTPLSVGLYEPGSDEPLVAMERVVPTPRPAGQALGVVTLTKSGEHRLEVRATRMLGGGVPANATVEYRLELYQVDPKPEHVPDALQPDVLVAGERIDHPDDVDEFSFQADAGDIFDLFLFAEPANGHAAITALVTGPGGAEVAEVVAQPDQGRAFPPSTGFFTAPEPGAYRVRMSGEIYDSLAYDLLLHPVDPAPEHSSSTILADDSVPTEVIDPPSDIDEFIVETREGEYCWILVSLAPGTNSGGVLRVDLRNPEGVYMTGDLLSLSNPYMRSGPWVCPFQVHLQGGERDGQRFTGGYQIVTSGASTGPEVAPAVLVPGDTITETVEPLGDWDRHAVRVGPRTHLDVLLQGLGEPGGDPMVMHVGPPGEPPVAWLEAPSYTPTLGEVRTRRITFSAEGEYHIEVLAGRMGPGFDSRGSYRLAVLEIDPRPETAAPVLALGDSVVGEALDELGDVDRFTVVGAPGQLAVLAITGEFRAAIEVFDPASGNTLSTTNFQPGPARFTAPLRLDANGELHFEVLEACAAGCAESYRATGPYTAYAWPFDPAPERAPARIELGDTVADAIDNPADVDEYSIDGNAGQTLRILIGRPADAPPDVTVWISLVAPDGEILSSGGIRVPPGTDPTQALSHDLPRTGTYTIRIHTSRWDLDATPYSMSVQ